MNALSNQRAIPGKGAVLPPTRLAALARACVRLGAFLGFGVAAAWVVVAQERAVARSEEPFEFRLIAEKNIFNPKRTSPSSRPVAREERPPAVVESFALVGTMSYEKGKFAFFEGSRSEFRKAVSTGEAIAGFAVTEISPTGVTLEAEGRRLELPVNSQMQREDDGPWRPGERSGSFASNRGSGGSSSGSRRGTPTSTEARSERTAAGAESARTTASPDAKPAEANADDILKRLMEQRQKELK